MSSITLKDIVYLLIIAIFAGFSVWEFSKNTSLEISNKEKKTQIDTLQTKLSKCNPISNNISIGKLKGKANANLHQFLAPNRTDTLFYVRGYCDTMQIVKWFCLLPRNQRRQLEKFNNKDL